MPNTKAYLTAKPHTPKKYGMRTHNPKSHTYTYKKGRTPTYLSQLPIPVAKQCGQTGLQTRNGIIRQHAQKPITQTTPCTQYPACAKYTQYRSREQRQLEQKIHRIHTT